MYDYALDNLAGVSGVMGRVLDVLPVPYRGGIGIEEPGPLAGQLEPRRNLCFRLLAGSV